MIVNCDKFTCTANIAGECVNVALRLHEGKCQDMQQSNSTGEVIDQEPATSFAEHTMNRFNKVL